MIMGCERRRREDFPLRVPGGSPSSLKAVRRTLIRALRTFIRDNTPGKPEMNGMRDNGF